MSDKIIVPTLGESVTEATVSKWLKNQGEKVSADEPIVELETDKVNVEVPAPSNGVLEKINVNEGETVNVGSLLGTINGSSKETLENAKEIKKYSPPKKQVQKKKKVDERPQIFDQEPLKLEDEPLQLEKEKSLRLTSRVRKKFINNQEKRWVPMHHTPPQPPHASP